MTTKKQLDFLKDLGLDLKNVDSTSRSYVSPYYGERQPFKVHRLLSWNKEGLLKFLLNECYTRGQNRFFASLSSVFGLEAYKSPSIPTVRLSVPDLTMKEIKVDISATSHAFLEEIRRLDNFGYQQARAISLEKIKEIKNQN